MAIKIFKGEPVASGHIPVVVDQNGRCYKAMYAPGSEIVASEILEAFKADKGHKNFVPDKSGGAGVSIRVAQSTGSFSVKVPSGLKKKNLTDWLWERNINFTDKGDTLVFSKNRNPTTFSGLEEKIRKMVKEENLPMREASIQTRPEQERIGRAYDRINMAKRIAKTLVHSNKTIRTATDNVTRFAERIDKQTEYKDLTDLSIRSASRSLRDAGINVELSPGEIEILDSHRGRTAGSRVIRKARITLNAAYPFVTTDKQFVNQKFRVAVAYREGQVSVEGLCDVNGDLYTISRGSLEDIRNAQFAPDKYSDKKPKPGEKVYVESHEGSYQVFGEDSGFSYANFSAKEDAEAEANRINKKRSAQKTIIENPENRSIGKANPELESIRRQAIELNSQVEKILEQGQAFMDALASKSDLDFEGDGLSGLQSAASSAVQELQDKIKDLPENFIEFSDKVIYAKMQSVRLNDASWKDMIDAAIVRGKGQIQRVASILNRLSLLFKKLTADVSLKKYEPGEFDGKEMDKVVRKNQKALDRINQYEQSQSDLAPTAQKYFLDEAEGQIQKPQRGAVRKVVAQTELGLMFLEELSDSISNALSDIEQLNTEVEAATENAHKELSRDSNYPLPRTASLPKFSVAQRGPLIPRRTASKKFLSGFSASEQLEFKNAK